MMYLKMCRGASIFAEVATSRQLYLGWVGWRVAGERGSGLATAAGHRHRRVTRQATAHGHTLQHHLLELRVFFGFQDLFAGIDDKGLRVLELVEGARDAIDEFAGCVDD